MATTPVMNPYGGGVGTSGSFNMPGMSNSGMNPVGGSGMNPAGVLGGSNNASGVPMANAKATPGTTGTTGTVSGMPASGNPTAPMPTSGIAGTIPTTATPVPQGSGTSLAPTATGENGQVDANGAQTQRQTDRTLGELQNYYGEGVGSYIYNLMQTGGINENVANQTNTADINAMQGGINQGSANLNSTLGAQGISANSSTNALANSQYQQGATAQENAVINNNYMQEYTQGQQMLESLLPGVLKTNQEGTANESNWMDDIGNVLGIAGSVAGLGIPGLGGLFKGSGGGSSDNSMATDIAGQPDMG